MKTLNRYIKNSKGEKVEQKTTSINIEARHLQFLKSRNLNLSHIVRDYLNELIEQTEKEDLEKSGS